MIYEYKLTDFEAIIDCLLELQDAENKIEASRITSRNSAELYFNEIQNKLNNNLGQIFVSKKENEITGVLIVYIEENEIFEKKGKHLLVSDIVVKSNYRNLGIGKELMKKAELFALENGIDEIRIYTLINNKVALNLYRNNDYKDFGIALTKKITAITLTDVITEKSVEGLSSINIRHLYEIEEIPYPLLLLADDSKDAIDKYLLKGELFVAESENDFVGTFILQVIDEGTIEIKNIAVTEKLQGKRIGTTMLKFIVKNAKQRGFKTLIVGTCDHCVKEIEFYKKSGFSIANVRKNFFIDNYKEPIYENGIQIVDMIVLSMTL